MWHTGVAGKTGDVRHGVGDVGAGSKSGIHKRADGLTVRDVLHGSKISTSGGRLGAGELHVRLHGRGDWFQVVKIETANNRFKIRTLGESKAALFLVARYLDA